MSNTNSMRLIPDSCGYVAVNGVNLYHEIYGNGTPLLYLHGGLGSGKDFRRCIPALRKQFKLIIVDRKGHGRSYDDGEPFSYTAMADSMDAFLTALGVDAAHVLGWSDGGIVALQLAGRYPNRVKKLIAVGANYRLEGMNPDSIEWTRIRLNVENPGLADIEKEYRAISPMPDNYPKFIRETRAMWLRDPMIKKDDLARITAPTLLMIGDRDMITPEHTLEIHALVKKSQLCILPNTTHFVFAENGHTAVKIYLRFLKEKVDL